MPTRSRRRCESHEASLVTARRRVTSRAPRSPAPTATARTCGGGRSTERWRVRSRPAWEELPQPRGATIVIGECLHLLKSPRGTRAPLQKTRDPEIRSNRCRDIPHAQIRGRGCQCRSAGAGEPLGQLSRMTGRPAPSEVEERLERPLVDQRSQGKDERTRRHRPGIRLDPSPCVAQRDLCVEKGIDDPVVLTPAAPRRQPPDRPAEGEQPNTIYGPPVLP